MSLELSIWEFATQDRSILVVRYFQIGLGFCKLPALASGPTCVVGSSAWPTLRVAAALEKAFKNAL